MSGRLPLAALLALRCSPTRSASELAPLEKTLLTAASDNPIAYAETGWEDANALPQYRSAIDKNLHRFPSNYLFALTDVWLNRVDGNSDGECKASEQVARSAPASPDAWLTMGATIRAECPAIRKGRYFYELTASERAFLDKIYPQWLQAVQHATKLDPLYGKAWLRTAQAATFAGDQQTAFVAFDKALQMEKDNPETYYWGLQMFQPKWYNAPQKLLDVAEKTAAFYDYGAEAFDAVGTLNDSHLQQDAERLTNEIVAKNRDRLQREPNDPKALLGLAWGLEEQKNYPEAVTTYQKLIQQDPNNVEAHYGIAMVYYNDNFYDRAIPEFQQTLRLKPTYNGVRPTLGYCLKVRGRYAEAEQTLKEELRSNPQNSNAHTILGDTYLNWQKPHAAVAEYAAALRLSPYIEVAWRNLSVALGRLSKWNAAIAAGETAIRLDPSDIEAHQNMSYVYGMDKQPQKSDEECRIVLQRQPNNITAHENLADALAAMGKVKEAHEEWQYVLQREPNGEDAMDARKTMAKYPDS